MTDIDDDGTDEAFKIGLQEYMNEQTPTTNAKLFNVTGDQYTGVMVALFPSPEVAAQIAAIPGVSIAPEQLHITLAYIASADMLSDAQIAKVIVETECLAKENDPIIGTINGMGRFNASQSSDGQDVVFAVVDLPGLDEVRAKLIEELDECECEVSDDHGFTPHMTLAYIDPGGVSPITAVPTIPVRFDNLTVAVGGKRVDFPLLGIEEQPQAQPQMPMANNSADGVQVVVNAAGAVKEVTRKGKRYLVAPTVALRAGVLNGEYVPADEVAKYADAWNGRPVPLGHPKQGDMPISANSMDLWDETPAMFWNAHVDGDALKGEIWLDVAKAEAVGGLAVQALQRLRNGQPVEVSTGYFRDLVVTNGTIDGEAYTGIARNLRPDHIALLLNETGACSWADGCGTPRINDAQTVASQSFISALLRNVIDSLGGRKVDKTKIIEGLAANAQCKCTKPQLEAMETDTLVAFAESLAPVVNEDAPAPTPAPVEVVKEVVPAELAQLAKVVEQFGGIEKLTAALAGVVTNAEQEKADLVKGLVNNERNLLSEAELQALPTDTLRKLHSSLAPRLYVGGADVVATNAQAGSTYVLQMPSPFAKKEAK